jgi:hypothetical protein
MFRAGGYLTITGPDNPKERDTYTCCHCNKIVVVKPGSGKTRGFCFMCKKPHCGAKTCYACIPFEAKLEAMEGKKRLYRKLEEARNWG